MHGKAGTDGTGLDDRGAKSQERRDGEKWAQVGGSLWLSRAKKGRGENHQASLGLMSRGPGLWGGRPTGEGSVFLCTGCSRAHHGPDGEEAPGIPAPGLQGSGFISYTPGCRCREQLA